MRAIACVLAGALVIGLAATARAQDGLTPVRELYESASYEAALAALDSMVGSPSSPTIEAEQYRVFCLVALGRASEAERVIERIVTADPTFRLAEADTSPRILETFATVRRRALPAVVSELYDDGKAAFDRRQFAEAERALVRHNVVKPGDLIVLTIGEPIGKSGGTNTMKIVKVGEHLKS